MQPALTPEFSWENVLNYGFIGFYVGIVPITLGLIWYPFMKRMKKSWINGHSFPNSRTPSILIFWNII